GVICAGCGETNREGARFCRSCGEAVIPRCGACGADIPGADHAHDHTPDTAAPQEIVDAAGEAGAEATGGA
ncbi:MAG TPA: DUF2321 domain-containing protein, partial [Acidimicrobiia bacterium]|nr:DUF2321 domain-containing protein [Acidimicrobiia bacterium]